jgi:hypothetical protein
MSPGARLCWSEWGRAVTGTSEVVGSRLRGLVEPSVSEKTLTMPQRFGAAGVQCSSLTAADISPQNGHGVPEPGDNGQGHESSETRTRRVASVEQQVSVTRGRPRAPLPAIPPKSNRHRATQRVRGGTLAPERTAGPKDELAHRHHGGDWNITQP